MKYTPISPFMRPISHVHLQAMDATDTSLPQKPVGKWDVLRELSKAQAAFGITDRDLTVLQGLLSFYPKDTLDAGADMVVFPSNRAICERLHNMPCSTMRRHLAKLVKAGLLIRRDSPNGKRYVRKSGEDRVAFGFDLTPLLCRAAEITRAAEAMREIEDRIRRLREVVSLMRRDMAALAEFGQETQPGLGLWDQLRDASALTARALRRKLGADDLMRLRFDLEALLDTARDVIDGAGTEEMITNGADSEHHHLNSKPEHTDLEQGMETGPNETDHHEIVTVEDDAEPALSRPLPRIPLHLVIESCPSLKTFYSGEIRHWHQLHDAAVRLRPAMGITVSAWEEAQRCMGPEQAAIVVVAMLERFEEIRSPGGYLRALTAKAAKGAFSCGPMVMALFGRQKAAA